MLARTWPPNDNAGRKWRRMRGVDELHSAPNKPNFMGVHDKVVPPLGISSCGQQAYYKGIATHGFSTCLMYPPPDFAPIGRIHPAGSVLPALLQTIFLGTVVAIAFGIMGFGAYIQREIELTI